MRQNLNKSVSNIILISLASGNLNKGELSKVTGIHDKELDIFLEELLKDNKLKEEEGIYSLVR